MIPPRRPSIRTIPVAPGHRHAQPPEGSDGPQQPHTSRPRGMRLVWLGVGVVVACAALGLLLSTLFENAVVTIYPKTETVTLPSTMLAQPNAPLGTVSYQTISITRTASTTVQANGTQQVAKPTTGAITIYNSYSATAQTLLSGTRFAAPDGKIYRTRAAVTVPGETKNADGTYAPGSVTAIVYADAPGPDYNRSTPTSFTIPGFKSKPQYTKFSAQSQGAMSGGFVGAVPAVAPADEATAEAALKQQLQLALQQALGAAVPSGSIAAQGQAAITYADIAETPTSATAVTLAQSASETVVFVRASDVAAFVAKASVPEYAGEPVAFANPDAVALTLPPGGATTGQLALGMSGTATLVWQCDTDAFKKALAGKPRSQFEGIAASYKPAVSKATAIIRPFWKATFPADPAKITVQTAQN